MRRDEIEHELLCKTPEARAELEEEFASMHKYWMRPENAPFNAQELDRELNRIAFYIMRGIPAHDMRIEDTLIAFKAHCTFQRKGRMSVTQMRQSMKARVDDQWRQLEAFILRERQENPESYDEKAKASAVKIEALQNIAAGQKKIYSLSLDTGLADYAATIGDGNRTAGVERALADYAARQLEKEQAAAAAAAEAEDDLGF